MRALLGRSKCAGSKFEIITEVRCLLVAHFFGVVFCTLFGCFGGIVRYAHSADMQVFATAGAFIKASGDCVRDAGAAEIALKWLLCLVIHVSRSVKLI